MRKKPVVVALINDGRFAVLADRSIAGSPARWGDVVVKTHDDFDADDVVVERNFGGDMAIEVVKQAADRAAQAQRRPALQSSWSSMQLPGVEVSVTI